MNGVEGGKTATSLPAPPQRTRNGQFLSELCSTYSALHLLRKYPVRIEVKSV